MKFPCTGCGLCCARVGVIIKMNDENTNIDPYRKRYLRNFKKQIKVNSDGSCSKLDPVTKKCTIYADRPSICNLQYLYKTLHSPDRKILKSERISVMSQKDYYNMIIEGCEALITANAIGKEFIPKRIE